MIKLDVVVDLYILELTGIIQAEVDDELKIKSALDDFLKFIEICPLIAQNTSFDSDIYLS